MVLNDHYQPNKNKKSHKFIDYLFHLFISFLFYLANPIRIIVVRFLYLEVIAFFN